MSKKTLVKVKANDINLVYASKISATIDLVQPTDLYLIAGRATSKTGDIVAKRTMRICEDMPGCYILIVADTYMNALGQVLPALIQGWQREGWIEGIDYVTDKRPPKHFKKPYKSPLQYKHTISTKEGCFFMIGSLDQPSSLAGGSYQHRIGDEARLLNKKKLDRSSPSLRGEFVRFSHSPFYMGNTFTTDMPNILTSDDDWILSMENKMDQEQIELILQAAFFLNDIKREMKAYEDLGVTTERKRLLKAYNDWLQLYYTARKESTFYYMISSMVNIDILTEKYFKATFKSLGPEEFKTAILSFKINVAKGEKFYSHLGDHHFYEDGTDLSYFNQFDIFDTITDSCKSLSKRYYDADLALEAGVDFGDMSSMVTGQRRGNYLYALKEFYTLHPEDEMTLGAKYREFYKDHKYKVLYLYYDRAGNQNAKIKGDKANYLKNAIEYLPDGTPSGWTVHLMNEFQGNIYQEEEFNLAKQLMGESVPGLPKLKIDKLKCKCLTSSLKLTKIIVKTDQRTGTRTIHKDKSSEKLPLASRPMFSTNFSDAFKYWICRPDFFNVVNVHDVYSGVDPSVIGK